jgi:two-component system sensor kinase FixL
MTGSRIVVGAVSHEIRNVCGAIAVIYENLVRGGMLAGNKDFEALRSLVETLNHIASWDLKQSAAAPLAGGVDIAEVLDDLRIVLEPSCEDAGIEIHWDIARELPPVWAERHSLLQVLLNLTKNSEAAMRGSARKRLEIAAEAAGSSVSIRVSDSGPGIRAPELLFQPFQKGANSTGLGLFLSRAFVRSFRGDLRHDPSVAGCSFIIELAATGPEADYAHAGKHGTHTTLTPG